MQIAKPLPLDDSDSAPYWEAAAEHRLVLMKCAACELYVHPPGPRCPQCGGSDPLEWVSFGDEVHGTVYSYVTVHRAVLRSFVDDAPYVVALCDIDGAPGVHLAANLFGADVNGVQIGSRVTMFWEDRAPGHSLPQWQLSAETEGSSQ